MRVLSRISFRSFAIAALFLIPCLIQTTYLFSVPDPVFQPDSGGYLSLAIDRLFGPSAGPSPVHRGLGYPLFLFAILRLSHRFLAVLAIQHLLLVATGLCAGYLCYRFVYRSALAGAFIFFATSALPVPTVYAHMILSETLYTFVLVAFALAFLEGLEKPLPGIALAAGCLVVLAVETRAVGLSLILALGSFLVVKLRSRQVVKKGVVSAATAIILLLAISIGNFFFRGFFGTDKTAGSAMFCSAAPYIDPDSMDDLAVRRLIAPILAAHRDRLSDGEWVYGDAAGPVKALEANFSAPQVDRIMRQLGLRAILRHPWFYAGSRLRILGDFIFHYCGVPGLYGDPDFSFFVYRGLVLYQRIIGARADAWSMLHIHSDAVSTYLSRLRPVMTGGTAAASDALDQLHAADVYHYGHVALWWRPLWPLVALLPALPCLALLLGGFAFFRRRESNNAIVLLMAVAVFHMLFSTFAAFQDPRFSVPVLPILWILAIGGGGILFDSAVKTSLGSAS